MELGLIVADTNETLLMSCEEWCSLQPILLRTVRSGIDCLRELRRVRPDVLVLGSDLPWGGGDGVLHVMADDPKLSGIPVIWIDGDAGARFPRTAWARNVCGCLVKPFDVDTLFEIVVAAADCMDALRCM